MDELKKLYDTLVRDGYYTNSYEEFIQKYNGSDAYKDQVFGVVSRDGLYTKSKEEFLLKYKSPELKTESFVEDEVEVKKKDASDSDSEVGLLERFKTKFNIQEDDIDLREQPPVQAIDQTRVAQPKFRDPIKEAQARESQEAYDAQRKLDMEAFKTKEKLEQEAQLEQQKINQTLLQQSEQFQNDLSIVTADLIAQEEDDVVPVLNKKFQKYGFSFEKTGIGDALVVTNFDGSSTETIDLDPFTTDTEILESQKLKNFLSQHALEEFETNEALDFEGKSLKAQQLRRVGLINADGTASTVLMTSYEADGKHYAIPTLFPKNPEFYGTNPNDWMKLDFEEAKKVAEERGEVFQFDTEEEAQRFAEGEWKDTHSTDAVGKKLYSDTGLNFKTEQAKYDKYLQVRDKIDFIESQVDDFGADYIEELTPEQKKLYGGLYVDGILRDDTDEVLAELKKIEDDLYSEVNTNEKIGLREKYDLTLQKKYSALAKDASIANYQAKAFEEALEVEALETFGVELKNLTDVKPETERDAALLDSFKVQVASLNAEKQHAANIYESAKTFYSAKYDKTITDDFEEGAAAVYSELRKGLNDGNASEIILQLSTGMAFDFQSLDLDNEEDRKKAAEMIVALKTKNRGKKDSKALSRWNRAKGFRESLDAFIRNPRELALSMAANSIGMMLPYGAEIVTGSTVTGAGIGAGIGATGFVTGPGGVLTTTGGAIAGGLKGLRGGMALTSLAMEYTNEYFAAMESEGYDVLNAKDVELAMQDEDVWALAKERGLKRGIPIALVDYLTGSLAGRVFKVGKTATRTKKIASQLAERAIFDPIGEMSGEALAQVVVGDELDFKEIAAEGIGGFGNNASMMVVNKLIDGRNNSNIELASKLTDINFIVNEKESDTRISAWTNNMVALGKINEDQGQRIQKNLGLSKDADNMLDFGRGKNNPKNKRVKARLMELLSAKEEYTADTNRKEVFSQKIKDINGEIAYLLENKTLAPDNQRAKIEAIFSPGVEVGDVRAGLSQYVIDGKSYSKQEFLKRLGKMSVRELTKFNGKVANDEEVANILNEKIEDASFTEETIDATDVPNIYGSDVVTHKTKRKEAIENWINGGQIIGRNENLDEFVEGTPIQKTAFNVDRDNRQAPNFQTGKVYSDIVSDVEGGYVIVSKPGTIQSTDLQPNLNFVNKATLEESRGVVIPKPGTPARDISNYDIYKVVDGKMVKQNPNQFKTKTDAVQKPETESVDARQQAEDSQGVGTGVPIQETPGVEATETEQVASPIQDNLQENETVVQTEEDAKGRVFTTTKQESVRERDGMKVTKFKFNRSDKATDQRNDSFVSEEVALADTNYEINPEDRLDLQDGETATYEINEIREGDTGVGASVKFTTIDADGNKIGSFQGDVTLVEKTNVAPTTKPQTIVAVAPFFDTTIESAEQAQTLRESEGYQQYKNNLTGIGQQLGLEVEVEEGIGGYKNDAGTEIVEISNRVVLKNATIEQAQEYAALTAALAPETQESSIAAEYVEEGSEKHNGNEYILNVSDTQGVMNALKKAGITDYSINEDTGEVSFINIFDFDNPALQDKIGIFVEELEANNITYEKQNYRAVNSVYVDQGKRKEILGRTASQRSADRQTGSDVYNSLVQAIENDAKFEGITTEEYFPGFKELQASSNAAAQEVADLESTLDDTDSKVDFRKKDDATFTPIKGEVDAVTKAINETQSGNVSTNLVVEPEGTIDVNELNSRTDRKLPSIKTLEVINGIPAIFNISDQLTTGNIVNIFTGNTIDNLRGGLGFTGTIGNENAAWASTTREEALKLLNKAKEVYNDNKELFDKFWKDNPEFNGHVPMNIVKMGEGSISSNEAVFRVLKDNLSKIPAENKVKALEVLRQDLQDFIDKRTASMKQGKLSESSLGKYQEEINGYKKILSSIENFKSIEQILDAGFLAKLTIPTREFLSKRITTGSIRKPGAPKTKVSMPNKKGKPVVIALLEGMEPSTETASLTHIQEITDLITEPQLSNIPSRSIIALQAVDVTATDVIETNHPNYPFGPKGKTIGILEQPVSLVDTYPEAYRLAMAGLTKAEGKQETVTKTKAELSKGELVEGELAPSSVDIILNNTLLVQWGLPGRDFVGALAQNNMDDAAKLNAFMNIAFPSVTISTEGSTFNNVMESEGVKKYLKGDEVIYGVTVNGDIYINPDVHNSQSALFNTSIHEMGHVWTDYLQTTKKGKAIYAQGVKLVEQTEEYKKQLKNFNGDKAKAANETMAILIGNKGQTIADGAVKSKFTQWLLGMWNYIKSQFKMSKDLTAEEIQDMNLDTFLGTALADIFAGKKIDLTKAQEKKLKNPDAAFSKTDSMGAIIDKGRQNGFSDASIKEVLKGRGFKVADIISAMEVNVDAFTQLPEAFGRVEGGVSQGMQLFNEVRQKLSKFATPEKTLSDVRQKAMDLIKENPIYKAQPEQTQMEILVDFDKTLDTRSNVAVQKEIAAIKNNLRQRKINSQNLKAAQIQLRNYIRKALPKSKTYTQAQINKLISRVTKSTVDTFQADTEYVMNIVDQQKVKMKNALVKDMLKLVKAKAMTAFTKSGKRRAKGLSREGTAYFKAVKQILTADIDDLNKIQQDLQNESTEINNLIEKQNDGQKLTQKEQAKVYLALAMDTFGDVSNMSLEEVQDLMQQLKDVRANSIAMFKSRRLARVEANKAMKEKADAQIKDTNPMLFDADGNVLNKNERNARRNEILSHFRNFEIGKGLSSLSERMKFSTAKDFIQNMKQMFQHLGTLSNVLDRVTQGKNFFTKNVYDALNRMDDLNNAGLFQTQKKLDDIANTIPGITKGVKQIYSKLNSGVHVLKLKRSDTGREYTDRFNADELMRIYALSLNDTQRQKLEAQGITPEVIENIKSIIGPEAVEFTDKTVNFLSNEYYESVNDVYSYVNDVNLGYVNNYFPTSTIQKETTKKMITDGDFNGVFNAESAPAFKERVDMRSDVDLHAGTFTTVLKNHVDTMEKYKAYAVGTQRLNALFKIDSVNVLLEEMGVTGPIKKAVNFAINPDSGKDASLSIKLIARLQTQFTGFALAFKAIQILKQATSFVNAYSDYSYFPANSRVPRVIQASVDLPMFMIDGAKVALSLGKDLVGKKGAVREAMEISPTFRKRVEQGLEGDVYGLESGSQTFKKTALTGGRLKRAQAAFKTAAASPTIIGDVLGVMGYMINYKRNIANGMSKADAVKAFNDYNATQQSRRGTDKIPLQMNSNIFNRAFTMFGSTLFLQMNKVMQSTTNITRDISNKKRPRSKDTRDLALNLAVANVLFVGVSNIAKFVKGDDEDKEAALKKMAEAMMGLNLIYQIPFLGSTVEGFDVAGRTISAVKGEEYKQKGRIFNDDIVNPVASVIQKYRKLTKNDENKVGAVVRALTEITIGAQLDPFIGLYNYFGGEEEDLDPAMYDIMGISPSYRPENKGSVSKGMSKSDMKKFAPGLYEELYGPGGNLEPIEQMKKDERKRKRDLQKEIDAAMGLD